MTLSSVTLVAVVAVAAVVALSCPEVVFANSIKARVVADAAPSARVAASRNPANGGVYEPDFDFFVFAQGWPGSWCESPNVACNVEGVPPTYGFLLHGLWPNYDNGSYPSFCNNIPFDLGVLEPLLPQMELLWPALNDTNTWFWSHEYSKHGTCALSVYANEYDFFAAALNRRETLDLLPMLASHAIYPGTGQTYALSTLSKAVYDEIGVNPVFGCSTSVDKQIQLSQVWLCVDKFTLRPFECSDTFKKTNEAPNVAHCGYDADPVVGLPPFPKFDNF